MPNRHCPLKGTNAGGEFWGCSAYPRCRFTMPKGEGKTAAWAGNSPDMVQRHYKGLVKRSAAKKFWLIVPPPNQLAQEPTAEG